jgi:hypothetical protein
MARPISCFALPGRSGLASLLGLAVLLSACTIEDRTPTGSRKDQAEIQRLIYAYHRAAGVDPSGDPSPGELRVVRMDLRQVGDLAAAWVTTRLPGPGDGEVVEHFVLRRSGDEWRVVNVGVASVRASASPRRASP